MGGGTAIRAQTNAPNLSAVLLNVDLNEFPFQDLAHSNKHRFKPTMATSLLMWKWSATASMAGEYTDDAHGVLIVVIPYNAVCISFFSNGQLTGRSRSSGPSKSTMSLEHDARRVWLIPFSGFSRSSASTERFIL